jgi:hypothetical protein
VLQLILLLGGIVIRLPDRVFAERLLYRGSHCDLSPQASHTTSKGPVKGQSETNRPKRRRGKFTLNNGPDRRDSGAAVLCQITRVRISVSWFTVDVFHGV